jgi:pilus assembly protein CpaC
MIAKPKWMIAKSSMVLAACLGCSLQPVIAENMSSTASSGTIAKAAGSKKPSPVKPAKPAATNTTAAPVKTTQSKQDSAAAASAVLKKTAVNHAVAQKTTSVNATDRATIDLAAQSNHSATAKNSAPQKTAKASTVPLASGSQKQAAATSASDGKAPAAHNGKLLHPISALQPESKSPDSVSSIARPAPSAVLASHTDIARPRNSAIKKTSRPQPRPHSKQADDDAQSLTLPVSGGRLLHLQRPASTVFVSDPTIADVQVPNANQVFVLGKKVGSTTVFALDSAGLPLLQRTIIVSHDLEQVRHILAQRFPSLHLEVKSAPGSLMVSGQVNRAEDIAAITQTLKPFIGDKENLVNQLALNSPTQVNLHVRIAEVSRTILQQIGVNWSAFGNKGGLLSGRATYSLDSSTTPPTGLWNLPSNSGFMGVIGSGVNQMGVIDMLDRENLMTTLAEPNLTTISGETASFLAGGEYPIPVPQGGTSNTITVEYKDFGVGLKFTPTVQASDRISLKVNPEVSELDTTNSITFSGITIPALTVRRIDTTVELASGQSLVLGGLLQDNTRDVLSQMPGLGRLPILGKLFSSTDYQHSKTELVIIVTPYLVRPVGPGTLQTPLDSLINPSDVEGALQRQAKLDPYDSATPRLNGNAGFVY